jgi:hypothetical protein
MEEIETVTITKTQYNLLNQIRGLQQDAFHMVVRAKQVPGGYELDGKNEDFRHLVRDLYDELEIAPASRRRTVYSLIHRLEPDDIEF